MDVTTRHNLGALVHRHYNLMKPAIDMVKEALPESAVKQLVKCQRAVDREIREASGGGVRCSAVCFQSHVLRRVPAVTSGDQRSHVRRIVRPLFQG